MKIPPAPIVWLCVVILEGCIRFPSGHTTPLNEADYASYLSAGTALISGEVAVTMRNGSLSTGAESTIYLIPVTPYTAEWFEHYVLRDRNISGADPRSFRATRSTVVGADGRFRFHHLPAGDFYLVCTVTRTIPPLHLGRFRLVSPATERVNAYASISVTDGEEVQVRVERPPT